MINFKTQKIKNYHHRNVIIVFYYSLGGRDISKISRLLVMVIPVTWMNRFVLTSIKILFQLHIR